MGRSGHTSTKVAVLRSLFFEYFIQTRINDGLELYYAENIYDSAAHNCYVITDQTFYMPFSETIFCFKATK